MYYFVYFLLAVMSLSLCAGNVVLECDETRNFNTFTCTGFTAQQTVLSKLVYDNQIIALGSCQPLTGGTSTCIPGALSKAFHLSRTSATASSISALSGTTLSTFSEKGSLTCTSQEGNDETTCLLDYICKYFLFENHINTSIILCVFNLKKNLNYKKSFRQVRVTKVNIIAECAFQDKSMSSNEVYAFFPL